MRKIFAKGLAVVLVMLSGVLFVACKSSPPATSEIELGKLYYIKELRTGAFYYSGTQRVIERQKDLGRKDPSYCVFEDDWTRFRIGFFEWTTEPNLTGGVGREGWLTAPYVTEFIATNVDRGDGHISADLSGVVDGRIVHYKLSTSENRIIINADVTYTLVSNESETPHIVTRNTKVASFTRTTPSYIPNGGGDKS